MLLRYPVFLLILPLAWFLACDDTTRADGPPLDAGPPPALVEVDGEPEEEAHLHAKLDRLLKSFVKDGRVRYDGLKQNEGLLDAYLADLAAAEVEQMSRSEQLALWINAYNAYTLKLILRHYPGIESIRDIDDPWEIADWEVGGRKLSLDEMEHQILRKQFTEPRIHFAINCASMSCPDLRREAFVAERLDAQLEDQTRQFFKNPTKGATTGVESGLFGSSPTLRVSKILDWFEEDFEAHSGSVTQYVYPYLSPGDRAFVRQHRSDLELEYLDYDWSLNGQ